MPISTTLRRLDGGLYINADGLQTDQHGIPLTTGASSSIAVIATSPEGVTTAAQGTFAYDAVAKALYIKDSVGTGNTGWLQLL
jgi:hypothetical protein